MDTTGYTIPEKPILVVGATGAIGSEVVRALLERGAPVRVLVRSPEKLAALPDHVERVTGALEDATAVRRAVRGAHAAGNYYQTDEVCRDQLLSGTYPLPSGS